MKKSALVAVVALWSVVFVAASCKASSPPQFEGEVTHVENTEFFVLTVDGNDVVFYCATAGVPSCSVIKVGQNLVVTFHAGPPVAVYGQPGIPIANPLLADAVEEQ